MSKYARKFGAVVVLIITVLLIFCGVLFTPQEVAYAALPESYQAYISSSGVSEWYFGSDYLNIQAVLSAVESWKADPDFDWESLAADPVVVAVIDSGIGHAYTTDYSGKEVAADKEDYYETQGLTYKINPMFEDVLLTDENGNYVFTTTVDYNRVKDKSINVARDKSVTDIAYVLSDNTDDNHGTHVTGIVALLIHALGLEDYIKIMPIKANSSVSGTAGSRHANYEYTNLAEAIDFAVNNGADVINLSLTSSSSGFTFKDYYDSAVFVAAAGNSNMIGKDGYPAADSGVIGVMNYTSSADGATLWHTSNYGSLYDVAAPGVGIVSSIDGKDRYGALNGTSMASPVVSFAAALTEVRFRGVEMQSGIEITPALVRKLLRISADETVGSNVFPSLNLLGLATLDFFYDKTYEGDIYVLPEGVKASSASSTTQTLGKLTDITMKVKYLPTNSKCSDTVVWWYESGGVKTDLGTGETLKFTPPSTVGTYAVYCKLVDVVTGTDTFVCSEEDAFVFTVNYNVVSEDNSFLTVDGERTDSVYIEEKSQAVLKISGIDDVDPSKRNVIWYVDDVAVSTDIDFVCNNLKTGEHRVYATVNGVRIGDEISVTVCEANNKLNNEQIAAIVVATVIFILMMFGLLYKLIKNKREIARSEEADEKNCL